MTKLDLVFLAWAAGWIVVAIAVAVELNGLSELSRTVGRVGTALDQTGDAVQALGSAPLVGDQLGDVGARIKQAAASARESARGSRQSVDNLTVLLSLAIAVIPSVPLLGVYLPLRLARIRDARALQAMVNGGEPAETERFLAERALQALPYRELRRLSAEPWRAPADAAEQRRLAAAELRRLGLRRSDREVRDSQAV